ncbi:16S rRNA (cytosine(967)-C(5))-methyltransferase RsmB [Arenimonas sp.]|uniref:16S rRNA (cytosine(967)-C(5))-methyltransferase RsmB n=1 Tax=Arenimonas sp. TaxID=1872635 RepID=UPI0039E21F52
MSDAGAGLRAQAALSLAAVLGDGRSLKAVLAERLPTIPDARDRSLLEAICFAALRHRRRYDAVLASWLAKPLPKRDYATHCLLLAGLAQLDELGLSAYAAVAATAEAARHLDRVSQVGLVNAILRRATRDPWPEPAGLGERTSHPEWLLQALREDWPTRLEEIADANNRPAPFWLRVNTNRISREAYRQQLSRESVDAMAPAFPQAALRLDDMRAPDVLPGWREGEISVQDGAAQLAGEALPFAMDARVLDACAAPGGKTAQLATRLGKDGELHAIDVDARRLRKIEDNLQRLGLASERVRLLAADATATASWWDGRAFDAILLDAPCSATGIIRRQPDIKWHRRPQDIDALVALQARLLDALWTTLVPGGHLLYATCSLLKAENQAQVDAFLRRRPEAQAVELPAHYGHAAGSGRQRFPGEDGMDGFFYALLRKAP